MFRMWINTPSNVAAYIMKKLQFIHTLLRRLQRLTYEVKCFFNPHNVIHISELPRTWVDRDEVMYHACFQILVDFIELEQPLVGWDDKIKGRFSDSSKMRAFIEENYNPANPDFPRLNFYNEMSDEEKARSDANDEQHYKKNLEMLELYEWYKAGKYDFDYAKYSEMTGEELAIIDKRIEYVSTGKPKLITRDEFYQLQSDHEKLREDMLKRVIAIRGYLWT